MAIHGWVRMGVAAAGLALGMLLPRAVMAQTARNEDAIRDVTSGKLREAKASWWGFDPDDSTRALQAAIDSGVPRLIVDKRDGPWIVEPISLASNQEILFERGVEVLAKKGAFKGKTDALFRADKKENITLIGHGATLRMRRSDYDGPEYERAEWRHCLSFRSCKNIKVYGLTLTESGGDGIYLGTAERGVTNKGVHIKDVVCDRNYRQGISVITAEDLLIENTVLRDTDGTAPRAGIDFEPNHPSERLVNVVMRDCTTENNKGDGIVFYLPPMDATSEPVSVRIEGCKAIGDQGSAARVITGNSPGGAVKGSIEFVGCTFQGSKGAGISVGDKPVEGCRVRFERCQILDTAVEATQQAPIVLMARQGAAEPVGGVEFVECVVRDPVARNPMVYADMAGGVPVGGITGSLIIEKGGQRTHLAITEKLLGEWMPSTRLRALPRFPMQGVAFKPLVEQAPAEKLAFANAKLRRIGRMMLYARQGEEVRFRVSYQQVAKYSGNPLPVVITGPDGKEVKRAQAAFQAETEVSFTAPATGVYRITADPKQNYLRVLASSHPLCLSGEEHPINFIQSIADFWFWVPAGVQEFGVRVYGEGLGEAVKAALLDPAGKVVEEVDNAAQTHQFEVNLPKPSEGEAWCLRLAKPSKVAMEDHYVDLRGVPPLLAPSKEALLVPVK